MINGNEARLVERFMVLREGLAFGIDQLLEPPGLGAHCDSLEIKTTFVSSANTLTFVIILVRKMTVKL